MNIESMKTLLLLLPVCVSLILFPVLGEDEDRRMRFFFLSVLAISIQKQTEILRDKTSLVIQLYQKALNIASSFEHVRNSCDIAATIALKSR